MHWRCSLCSFQFPIIISRLPSPPTFPSPTTSPSAPPSSSSPQRSAKPCNAETPGDLLSASLITPTDLFYVRNHLPVPTVDLKAWKLKIEVRWA